MNRKQRAARNNAAAKAKKRLREQVMDQPKCNHCGGPESEHLYVPVTTEEAEAIKGHEAVCEIVPTKKHMH